jgi:hypothetical protein
MSPRPRRSRAQLIMRGPKPFQVDVVLATWPVIGSRIQLEVNLVETTRERDHEAAVLPPLDAIEEPLWQAEPQQRGRATIYPVRSEIEDSRNVLDRFREGSRELAGRCQGPGVAKRDEIEILGGPIDETDQQQATATNSHHFEAVTSVEKQLAKHPQGVLQGVRIEHRGHFNLALRQF